MAKAKATKTKKVKENRKEKTDLDYLKEKIEKIKEHKKKHIHDYKTIRQLLVLEARLKKLKKKKVKDASENK